MSSSVDRRQLRLYSGTHGTCIGGRTLSDKQAWRGVMGAGSLFVSIVAAVLLAATTQDGASGQVLVSPKRPVLDARELSLDRDFQLKMAALSEAEARLEPRIRNPRISADGNEEPVGAILAQERSYLQRHAHAQAMPQLSHDLFLHDSVANTAAVHSPCSAPTIFAVNGRRTGIVITPKRPFNHYRIEGCGFGVSPGQVRLEPDFGASPGSHNSVPIPLLLEGAGSWSDHEITVLLDSRLSGLFDSDVRLSIRRPDGRGVRLSGCRFVAVRAAATPLERIAASWVKLSTRETIHQLEYISPAGGGDPFSAYSPSMSALVIRSDSGRFAGRSDFYDFSRLNPGWTVESVQLQHYSIPCPGDVMRTQQEGNWNANFDARGFSVHWASFSCFSFIPPMFRFNMTSSEYAIRIWLIGPVGTQPTNSY